MMRSIRSLTSFVAASRFVPQAKEILTLLFPSLEDDSISSTPETAAIACSIGLVIKVSTSVGLAFS